jgi:hypothetical protein
MNTPPYRHPGEIADASAELLRAKAELIREITNGLREINKRLTNSNDDSTDYAIRLDALRELHAEVMSR